MTEFKTASAAETEQQFRQFLSYLFAQASTGKATTGVLAGLGVTQRPTADGSVIVGMGAAVVQASTTAGAMPLLSDADKTIDVLTGSPMGALPRWDLVIFNADAAAIQVVVGTANASPTDPTVSANHIKLARLRQIPTGSTGAGTIPNSAIDDLRTYTTLNVPVPDPVWLPYTPTWETNGLFPRVNSGSLTGRYKDIGKTRFVHVEFVRGGDTEAGSDDYAFGLPAGTYRSFQVSGSGYYVDNNPYTEKPVTVRGISSGKVALLLSGGGRLRYNTLTWAVNDTVVFDLTIELA